MIFSKSLEAPRQSFLESLRLRNYSPATLCADTQSLNTFFKFLATRGIDDVRDVTAEIIRDYQLHLSQQPFKVRTVCTKLEGAKRFFLHLEKTDAILLNPCLGMVLPKLGDPLPRQVLTQAEARAILNAPDTQTRIGIRDKAILELFYSTGIRLAEMANLTTHDVDVRSGFLRVNGGKGGKDRVVPMGYKATRYVREYLEKVRSEWTKENRDERALWLAKPRPHHPVDLQIISIMVRDHGKEVLGRSVSAHVWRHTCATHMVANGSNIAYVQRLLGHSQISTTQIYTRVSIPEVRETFKKTHPREKKR